MLTEHPMNRIDADRGARGAQGEAGSKVELGRRELFALILPKAKNLDREI